MASADYVHLEILSWSKHREELKTRLDELNISIGREIETVEKAVSSLGLVVSVMIWGLDNVDIGNQSIIYYLKGFYLDAVTGFLLPIIETDPKNNLIIKAAKKTFTRIESSAKIFKDSLITLQTLCEEYPN